MIKAIKMLCSLFLITILAISTIFAVTTTILWFGATMLSFTAPFCLLILGKFDILVIGLLLTPFLLMAIKKDINGTYEIEFPLVSIIGFFVCSLRFLAIVQWTELLNISAISSAIYFTIALVSYLRKMNK